MKKKILVYVLVVFLCILLLTGVFFYIYCMQYKWEETPYSFGTFSNETYLEGGYGEFGVKGNVEQKLYVDINIASGEYHVEIFLLDDDIQKKLETSDSKTAWEILEGMNNPVYSQVFSESGVYEIDMSDWEKGRYRIHTWADGDAPKISVKQYFMVKIYNWMKIDMSIKEDYYNNIGDDYYPY